MIYETVQIYPGRPHVTLTVYAADEAYSPRDALLVIPGGAYRGVCADREGEPIALRFLAAGVNAFVLNYTVSSGECLDLQPLCDASVAMRYIRENADKYHVNPNRVFAVGFSAGGHLAASLATLWHEKRLQEKLPGMGDMNRPEGAILCYPVLTMNEYTNGATCDSLTGGDKALMEFFSIEKHVDEKSAPAFFMHTSTDQAVPVENSLVTAQAYAAAKVPHELHIYPDGLHGVALANEVTWQGNPNWLSKGAESWPDEALRWMRSLPGR